MTQNKIALVTGGSRGLGKDMALSLAKKGMDVVLTYHSALGGMIIPAGGGFRLQTRIQDLVENCKTDALLIQIEAFSIANEIRHLRIPSFRLVHSKSDVPVVRHDRGVVTVD